MYIVILDFHISDLKAEIKINIIIKLKIYY